MTAPLIETVNLKKYFKTSKGMLHAVEDVNLKIYPGKTLGVVGESGCGKSTLGRTILRLHQATSGQVLFEGQDILKYKRREMKKVHKNMQMIFQDPYSSLDPRMSIHNIIAEPVREMYGSYGNKKELEEKVHHIMELCGLPRRYANSYPHELDGGRRQRVGLARAMVVEPRFIVCDEPVSALDVSIQAQILNLLMDLQEQRELAYMFITHDLCVVKHISDHIMVMYMGQVVEYASKEELFRRQFHPYTKALLSAIPTTELNRRKRERQTLTGEVTSPVNPLPGCRFAPRCPYATEKCKAEYQLHEAAPGHFVACNLC
ncbi:ABC transporter ATP-binding protein [Ruminococcus sp. 5_1_39BFAA]|uniref:ABC transporter ATP-binding protein n=1 Tax=Ruminococcus sp. 5_1_39BFAA TaxID=457412 RepID=UPI00356935F0